MNTQTISHYVTRQRSLAQAANLFRANLIQKTAAKKPDPFASALAHEVRNPLSNINLAVEMLQLNNLDSEQKTFLEIILRNSARINGLVTDLLTSYRTDEKEPERHSVHQLIDEVLAQTADRILLKTVGLSKDYACPNDKVLMNRQKIKIALTNIIINALDAMPLENGQLKVSTKSIDDNCIVVIEDNGIGISKENIAHIFEPYFTGKANGMGLGLSTTLNILQSNHASVKVESEEGTGTRFILSFGGMQAPNKTPRLSAYRKTFAMIA